MQKIEIHTDDIQLDQALKLAAVVQSGGEVKILIEQKQILLNGQVVKERRKKIRPGDVVEVIGIDCLTIARQ